MSAKPFFAHHADGGWAFELRHEPGKGYYLDVPAEGEYLYLSRQEAAARLNDYFFQLLHDMHDDELQDLVSKSVKDWESFNAVLKDCPGLLNFLRA